MTIAAWKHVMIALAVSVIALSVLVFVPFIVTKSIEQMVAMRVVEVRNAERVVTEWGSDNWSTSADGRIIEADIYGKKQLNARFVRDWEVAALAKVSGKPRKVLVTFLGDVSPGATRPVGAQSFGRWRFTAAEGERFETGEIIVSIAHDIDGKSKLTDAGPFFYIAPPE